MIRYSVIVRAFLVFIFLVSALPSWAQSRSNTGRHQPVAVKKSTEASAKFDNDSSGAWMLEINGGLFGGSDLFSASHTTGDTIAWDHGEARDLVSHRIRVGLKNSFGGGVQIQRRMNGWYSLRAGLSFSKMDLMAEAPVGETAVVFKYDQANVWLLNAGGEIRFTNTAVSYPYFTLDLVYLDFSPAQSEFLSQSNIGGRLGLGYHYQFDPVWAVNFEIDLSRTALSSVYFPTPEDADPADIEYENENHLSVFEAKFGIRVKI